MRISQHCEKSQIYTIEMKILIIKFENQLTVKLSPLYHVLYRPNHHLSWLPLLNFPDAVWIHIYGSPYTKVCSPRLAQLEGGTFERWGLVRGQTVSMCLSERDASVLTFLLPLFGLLNMGWLDVVQRRTSALSSRHSALPCFRPKEGDQIIKVFRLLPNSMNCVSGPLGLHIRRKDKRLLSTTHTQLIALVGAVY